MLLRLLVAEPVERRADSIGNAKGLLLSALSDFKMLPLNSAVAADIVRCYCELQDLCVLGEAYEEGFTLLVKADGILQVQEHQGDPVGNDVKLVLLEKLKMALGRRGE